MLTPDTILQGRYRIIRQLGQGGMGTVYEALALRLDTTVAIKETLFTEERLRKQFEREAQLLARLRHPALPRVIDHFDENDGLFLVMDYIPGEDLGELLLRKSRPFAVDEVLRWGDQLLDALDYLHLQDPPVIHRDIKPQNMKLSSRNQIILLDFGLAKGFAGQISRVNSSGSLFGFTPNYAPLEQIQGTGTGAHSDLYSLAATLYHLMTNVTPPDVLTRLAATSNGEPDPLIPAHELNPQVSQPLARVLQQAMSIGSSQRFSSAAEMRNLLRQVSQPQHHSGSAAKTEVLSEAPTVYGHTAPQYPAASNPGLTIASPAHYPNTSPQRNTITNPYGQAHPSQLYSGPYPQHQYSPMPLAAPASKSRTGLWVAAIAFCLFTIVLGVFVYLFWGSLRTTVFEQIGEGRPDRSKNSKEAQVQGHIKKGDGYYDSRDYEKAVAEYTEAIKLDPENAEAYMGRGNTYRRMFRDEESLADLTKAIQLSPKDSNAWRSRGNTYNAMRKFEQALADYNKAIELNSQNARAYSNRGNTYLLMNKPEKAIEDLNKAIELDPKLAGAYADRGYYYLKRGQTSKALADLNKAIDLDPTNTHPYINRSAYYVDTRKYDLAIADANKAIELGSKDPSTYNNRGLAYAGKGDYDRAIADYTEAIRLSPNYAYAYKNRSIAYSKKGERDLARSDYERAVRLDPRMK